MTGAECFRYFSHDTKVGRDYYSTSRKILIAFSTLPHIQHKRVGSAQQQLLLQVRDRYKLYFIRQDHQLAEDTLHECFIITAGQIKASILPWNNTSPLMSSFLSSLKNKHFRESDRVLQNFQHGISE